jgi:hypothetical protein
MYLCSKLNINIMDNIRLNYSEGNKLIAQTLLKARCFGVPYEYDLYSTGVLECIEDGENEQHFFRPVDMKFHTSWDWLKPCIDKINDEIIGIKTIDECTEVEWAYYNSITKMYMTTRIREAYRNVINFLQWYESFIK